MGFNRTKSDNSVYVWFCKKDNARVIVPVYVDNLTVALPSKEVNKRCMSCCWPSITRFKLYRAPFKP